MIARCARAALAALIAGAALAGCSVPTAGVPSAAPPMRSAPAPDGADQSGADQSGADQSGADQGGADLDAVRWELVGDRDGVASTTMPGPVQVREIAPIEGALPGRTYLSSTPPAQLFSASFVVIPTAQPVILTDVVRDGADQVGGTIVDTWPVSVRGLSGLGGRIEFTGEDGRPATALVRAFNAPGALLAMGVAGPQARAAAAEQLIERMATNLRVGTGAPAT